MTEYTFSKTLGANFDWVPTSTFGDSDIEASYFGDTHRDTEIPMVEVTSCCASYVSVVEKILLRYLRWGKTDEDATKSGTTAGTATKMTVVTIIFLK